MISKLQTYIGLAIGGILSILAIFLKGRSIGKKEEKAKQTKKVLDNVKKAKKTTVSINDNRRDCLRKRYKRK